jgi:hypothetical protein
MLSATARLELAASEVALKEASFALQQSAAAMWKWKQRVGMVEKQR